MADNQEQIESRLCQYVDGTLEAAELAEIEAHLQAHPQHRKLLSELRLMRDALRALPRESAPAEMSESFTGQLERSVLLDGIGEVPAEPRMRISRLPQLAAIAAIIALAGGLAIVLFYALPSTHTPQITQNTHPTISGNVDGSPDGLPKVQSKSASGEPAAPGGQVDQVSRAALPPVVDGTGKPVDRQFHEMELKSLAESQSTPQVAAIANSALTNDQVRALLGRADSPDRTDTGRPTVVMVVTTDDPGATTRTLGNYLETSNADWQPAGANDELAKSQTQQSTINGTEARDFFEGHFVKDAPDVAANAPSAPAIAGGDAEHGAAVPTTMPQTQPALATAREPIPAGQSVGAAAPASALDAAAATHPAIGSMQAAQLADNGRKDDKLVANALTGVQKQLADAGSRLYVVRNVSFQQATNLGDVLRQVGQGTQTPLFADKLGDGAFDARKYRGSQQQEVKPGSTVDLAVANPPPATRPQQLQSAKADNLEQARIDDAAKSKAFGAQLPQTNPAAPSAALQRAPVGGQIVQIDKEALLGSSPVDLVIVIQNAPGVPTTAPASAPPQAPAAAPTTAPATAPTTEPVMPPIAD
jgi:Putative zinc-finger